MTETDRRARWLRLGAPLAIAAVGLVFYRLFANRTFVGEIVDDAEYILASLSFLQGRMVSLSLRGNPPLNFHFPGFPVFLMPFVALAKGSWQRLQWLPITLFLVDLAFFWRFLRNRLSFGPRLLALALFAWSPLVANYAGIVATEPLFLFLMFTILWAGFERAPSFAADALLLALLIVAAFVRPEGILLAVALALAFAWSRRWRRAALVGLLPLFVWLGAFTIYSWRIRSEPWYVHVFLDNLGKLSDPATSLRHWRWQLLDPFRHLITIPGPADAFSGAANSVLAIVLLLLAIRGLALSLRPGSDQAPAAAIAFFWAFYVLLHGLLLTYDARHHLVLLPFLIVWLLEGVGAGRLEGATSRGIFTVAAAALAANLLWIDLRALRETRRDTGLPAATFEWIRSHTPADAYILSDLGPTVYLYTNRQVQFPLLDGPSNVEEFRYKTQLQGFDYIVYDPANARKIIQVNLPDASRAFGLFLNSSVWAANSPDAFERVYDDATEDTFIFRVKKDASFVSAYARYQEAMTRLSANDVAGARQALAEALRLDPRLAPALTARGILSWTQDHDAPGARRAFDAALQERPDYPPALLSLGRLEMSGGHTATAIAFFDRAEQAIGRTHEFVELLPEIRRERGPT